MEHEGIASPTGGLVSGGIEGQSVRGAPHPTRVGACVVRAGRVLYANGAALELLEAKGAADLVGRSLWELVAANDRVLLAREFERTEGSSWHVVSLASPSGAPAKIELLLEPEEPHTRRRVVLCRPLPVADPMKHHETENQGPIVVEKRRATPVTVLVCDDEARLAALTAGLLEEYGFEPITTTLGDEALTIISRKQPRVDLLLLDVNLSTGLSAQDIVSALSRHESTPKVILTSGLAEEDVPPDLRKHPYVAGYLAKPYSVEELIDAIDGAFLSDGCSKNPSRS